MKSEHTPKNHEPGGRDWRCSTCLYFDPDPSPDDVGPGGWCRKLPPAILERGTDTPYVRPEGWCGEHEHLADLLPPVPSRCGDCRTRHHPAHGCAP